MRNGVCLVFSQRDNLDECDNANRSARTPRVIATFEKMEPLADLPPGLDVTIYQPLSIRVAHPHTTVPAAGYVVAEVIAVAACLQRTNSASVALAINVPIAAAAAATAAASVAADVDIPKQANRCRS